MWHSSRLSRRRSIQATAAAGFPVHAIDPAAARLLRRLGLGTDDDRSSLRGPADRDPAAPAVGVKACLPTRNAIHIPREETVYNPREEVIDALFGAAERGDKNAQCRLVTLYAEGQLDVGRGLDPYAEAELAEALGPNRDGDNSRTSGRMPGGSANNRDALTVIGHLVAVRTSETREERERLRNLGIWSFRCLSEVEAELRAEIRASIDRATVNGVRALASRGSPEAQLLLGMAFALGVGVFENPVLAHMWFSVASANGNAAAAPGGGRSRNDPRADRPGFRTRSALSGLGLPGVLTGRGSRPEVRAATASVPGTPDR